MRITVRHVVHIMFVAWSIWAQDASSETLTGRVIGIINGDTLTVLVQRDPVTVRLADIDAPESAQPWGARSKRALSDLCLGKEARVETQSKHRKRNGATVYCSDRNANAEQVWQGMAWVLDRDARPESPLYILQDQAKAARRGLWADSNPMPPWKWQAQEMYRKGAAPAAVTVDTAIPAQTHTSPRKWVCERKEVGDRFDIDCGWK
jgi:endonuclease YncB( thermonuclease family)